MRTTLLLLLLGTLAGAQNPVQRTVICTDAGSNDTYACSPTPAVGSYSTGLMVRLYPNTANTGAATVNVSSLGAKTIKKVAGGITTDLSDNDLRAGQYALLIYDGTNFQMLSQLGNAATGGSSDPLTDPDFVDDFVGGGIGSGVIGELSWLYSGGSVSQVGVGGSGIWGWIRRSTASSANSFTTLYLGYAGNMSFPVAESWTMTFRAKLGSTPDANSTFQLGMSCASNLTTGPASAIYFRASGATPTWYTVTRSASSETANNTTYSVSGATFHKLVIRRIDGSTIGFKVDANAETTHTTNIPTGQCNPWISVDNGATAASQNLDIEFFRLQGSGVSR